MEEDARKDWFLTVDRLPEPRRCEVYDRLLRGEIYVETLRTQEDNRPIAIPSGMIHHWVGVVFIPDATLSQALAVLGDYEHHQEIYKPDIRQSRLIEQIGDHSKVFLQFFNKAGITVVLNANFDVSSTQFGAARRQIASRSTRIVEVADPDKTSQHELPVGNDHGYLWRLNTYWRVEEKDSGVYVQNASLPSLVLKNSRVNRSSANCSIERPLDSGRLRSELRLELGAAHDQCGGCGAQRRSQFQRSR